MASLGRRIAELRESMLSQTFCLDQLLMFWHNFSPGRILRNRRQPPPHILLNSNVWHVCEAEQHPTNACQERPSL
ncbi:hypothetical protein MPTK1_6g07370 [Marchantia polymorpha subsp. ruderalis]|uniref:Uncharacterized protein n=2 Tax=Marchantia polymorpha TaxID=3197 RepID=A0AAF6BPH6_MARPO|nr:hypothetical protein MARPO_0053s0051 [Marchantia polymorpha]BBN13910.1 hypothetical protein Mp_6g07370 [Marchantia polymorpha subsp. ruderalis]|eukprot:PTQ38112.1 hypothetical protein MARPO_0053s0051 [Marchantia polymorpha]